MDVLLRFPTIQYGFLELRGGPNEIGAMIKLGNLYSETPIAVPVAVGESRAGREVTSFTGEKLWYDAVSHHYTTLEGKKLLSGTAYAKRFEKEFQRDMLLEKTATKLGAAVADVAAAWDMRGDLGKTFGTSIHLAMECWFKFNRLGYGVPKHPVLKPVVETFPLKDADIKAEIMLVDLERGLCGQADGLQILGIKTGAIIDYKSDADITKNLPKHFAQLSFYAQILIAHGWTIPYVEVWNYVGEWKSYRSDVLALEL